MVVSPRVIFVPCRAHRDVALGHATGSGGGTLQCGLPVRRAHHHFGAVSLLQFRCALVMVAMSVADDDVFDVARVEAQFGQAVDDLRLRGPGEIRVDDDDARAGAQRPR